MNGDSPREIHPPESHHPPRMDQQQFEAKKRMDERMRATRSTSTAFRTEADGGSGGLQRPKVGDARWYEKAHQSIEGQNVVPFSPESLTSTEAPYAAMPSRGESRQPHDLESLIRDTLPPDPATDYMISRIPEGEHVPQATGSSKASSSSFRNEIMASAKLVQERRQEKR